MNSPERLYRSTQPSGVGYLHADYDTRFRVTISKPGPRGGSRPPLIDATLRAESYDEAVEFVEREFLARTKTEVSAG